MNNRTAVFRIDPYDLRLFSAIAETGTVTSGAKEMHISVPAASMRLKSLEHSVGTSLMHRGKQGILLTDAGKTLLRYAGRIQGELNSLHHEMANHMNGLKCSIRVATNTASYVEHLPRVIGDFLVDHPGIDIDIQERCSSDALLLLRQEKVDISIVAAHVDFSQIVANFFETDELVFISSIGSLNLPLTVSFTEIVRYPFVGLKISSGLTRFINEKASALGENIRYRANMDSFESVVDLVVKGIGVAIVPLATAQRFSDKKFETRKFSDSWTKRSLNVCKLRTSNLSSGALALWNHLSMTSQKSEEAT